MLEFFGEDESYSFEIKFAVDPCCYYGVEELANIFGFTRTDRILEWVKSGLKARRKESRINQFGGKWEILGKDVIEFLLIRDANIRKILKIEG